MCGHRRAELDRFMILSPQLVISDGESDDAAFQNGLVEVVKGSLSINGTMCKRQPLASFLYPGVPAVFIYQGIYISPKGADRRLNADHNVFAKSSVEYPSSTVVVVY